MRRSLHPLSAAALCAGLTVQACMSAVQPAASPAFFNMPLQEVASIRAFADEQERQMQNCAVQACDRAHYLRALAALYEDRAVAMKHFQAASGTPTGPYAASSRAWIRLLADGWMVSIRNADLVQATERLVRELLERETAFRQVDAQAVQALRQQIKDREKQISELTQQIDALKRVDQEVKDQVKPRRQAN